MVMAGIAAVGAMVPPAIAGAEPVNPGVPAGPGPLPAAPPAAATPPYLFHDEFDGPAGSAPDQSKWVISTARELIKNPVFWDRPENMGQYRNDRRNVFLDGNSNLVIRATKENGKYFGGKLQSTFWGGIGHTWEARIKFDCLTNGCWPAWWLVNSTLPSGTATRTGHPAAPCTPGWMAHHSPPNRSISTTIGTSGG
jgi:hypothetical protein